MSSKIHRRLIDNIYNFTGQLNPSQNNASLSVGTLPLNQFIYIIIGVVILICYFSCDKSIKDLLCIRPKEIFAAEDPTSTSTAVFAQKRRPSRKISSCMREEISKERDYHAYPRSGGHLEPMFSDVPKDLPLPVAVEAAASEGPSPEHVSAQAITQWELQIGRAMELDLVITNLQRIEQVRREAGASGDGKLEEARRRRGALIEEINKTAQKFQDKREHWSAVEWTALQQVIEKVQRLYPIEAEWFRRPKG